MSVPQAPQGPVPFIGIPDSQDYPRLIYAAPYFTQVPLAELIAPAVTEAVEAQLPSLVPPFVDQAAQDAVNQLAVLLAGSTMQGPLYLNPIMPTQPAQAASMAYVDSMIATAGIPEVPPTPIGQVWARMTGQWTPISEEGGTFLPIGGGTMQGQINMGGNAITNLPALPVMPNGAAPAQWVLQQISAVSLYQGTWNMDTYTPDLTQLSTHVNGWTWIAITTSASGVVIGPPIPGLQGQTVFNGDTVIYSATAGAFQSIHSGGLTLAEANALYLSLNGGQLSGPLLLNANATQPTQATTLQQVQTLTAGFISPEAPTDGQAYLRIGATRGWTPGLPLTGGVTTGAILLSGNASNALQAVPYQQLVSYTAGLYLPTAGGTMVGPLVLSGNASAPLNPVTLTQLNSMLGSYLPLAGGSLSGGLSVGGNFSLTGTASMSNTLTVADFILVNGANTNGYGLDCQNSGVWMSGALYAGGAGTIGGNLSVVGTASLSSTLTVADFVLVNGANTDGYGIVCQNGGVWMEGLFYVEGTSTFANSITAQNFILVTGANTNGYGLVAQNSGVWMSGALYAGGNSNLAGTLSVGSSITVGSFILVDGADGNGYGIVCQYSGGWFQGNVVASAFDQTSDPRVKTDIGTYIPGVSAISQLDPITFRYNGLGGTPTDPDTVTRVGLDASAVQTVVPQAVGSHQAKLHPTDADTTTLLTLDDHPLLMTLINAVKQLLSRVEALEAAASITPPAADTA